MRLWRKQAGSTPGWGEPWGGEAGTTPQISHAPALGPASPLQGTHPHRHSGKTTAWGLDKDMCCELAQQKTEHNPSGGINSDTFRKQRTAPLEEGWGGPSTTVEWPPAYSQWGKAQDKHGVCCLCVKGCVCARVQTEIKLKSKHVHILFLNFQPGTMEE